MSLGLILHRSSRGTHTRARSGCVCECVPGVSDGGRGECTECQVLNLGARWILAEVAARGGLIGVAEKREKRKKRQAVLLTEGLKG